MAILIKNVNYVDNGDIKQTGKYLFDLEDGTPAVELVVWNEKSKASEKHPDGKPWIRLPKNNPTNREYFSEDLFLSTVGEDGSVVVEVKTTPARVLGASGVKQDIVKYLSEEDALEYTELVDGAIEAFKAAKADAKKKKPEEMSRDELEAYIEALRNGTKFTQAAGPKSFLDMFAQADYDRYNELLALAAETKANAPKATRRPLTEAEKAVRAEKRHKTEISKAEALLQALQATAE